MDIFDNYKSLINEVCKIAFHEYTSALLTNYKAKYLEEKCHLKLTPKEQEKKHIAEGEVYSNVKFFKSTFFEITTNVNGDYLIEKGRDIALQNFNDWKKKQQRRKPKKEFIESIKIYKVED